MKKTHSERESSIDRNPQLFSWGASTENLDKFLEFIIEKVLKEKGLEGLSQFSISEFMENGADRYLTKDHFFIDSLIETIQQVIQ